MRKPPGLLSEARAMHAINRYHPGRRPGHTNEIVVAEDASSAGRPDDASPSAGKLRNGIRSHRCGAGTRHGGGAEGSRTPRCVVQQERLGTAHAAMQAIEHFGDGQVAILYADNPLIRAATLRRLLDSPGPAGLSLLAFRPDDPARYGRVIAGADGLVERIVEYADAIARGTCGRPLQRWRPMRRRRRHARLVAFGSQ